MWHSAYCPTGKWAEGAQAAKSFTMRVGSQKSSSLSRTRMVGSREWQQNQRPWEWRPGGRLIVLMPPVNNLAELHPLPCNFVVLPTLILDSTM